MTNIPQNVSTRDKRPFPSRCLSVPQNATNNSKSMNSTVKITLILLTIVLINLVQGSFTNVPPPPQRPAYFHSKEELKRYLQKVHEYHAIVGRWRLRRGFDEHLYLHSSSDDLFKFFDTNNDHVITKSEFTRRLNFRDVNE